MHSNVMFRNVPTPTLNFAHSLCLDEWPDHLHCHAYIFFKPPCHVAITDKFAFHIFMFL